MLASNADTAIAIGDIAAMRRVTRVWLTAYVCADAAAIICAYRGIDTSHIIMLDHLLRQANFSDYRLEAAAPAEYYRIDDWIDRGMSDFVAAHLQLTHIASGTIRYDWHPRRVATLAAAMAAADPQAVAAAAAISPNFARFVGYMTTYSAPPRIADELAALIVRVGAFNPVYAFPTYSIRFMAICAGLGNHRKNMGYLNHLRALARYDWRYRGGPFGPFGGGV